MRCKSCNNIGFYHCAHPDECGNMPLDGLGGQPLFVDDTGYFDAGMTWSDKAKALFGVHYRSVIAILSGVNKRTVERWDKGEYPVRPEVVDKINATYEIWRKDLNKG